jgi:biopolymer transport protein TolR
MSMSGSDGTARAVSEINVTPLIDVLLVLLIIFMVIVPAAPKGLDALLPQSSKSESLDPSQIPQTVVVTVRAGGGGQPTYRINQEAVDKSDLERRLAAIFSTRNDKVMFVQDDPGLEFRTVAEVVDMGHRAQVEGVGLITGRNRVSQ